MSVLNVLIQLLITLVCQGHIQVNEGMRGKYLSFYMEELLMMLSAYVISVSSMDLFRLI